MRIIYIITSFLALSLCLIVEANHYFPKYFSTKKGGINREGRKIGLRKTPDQNLPMIEWLPDGAFAPVELEGERWAFIIYKDKKYAIPKKRFNLGYTKLYDLFLVPTEKYLFYKNWMSRNMGWVHICSVLSIIACLTLRSRKRKVITRQIRQQKVNINQVEENEESHGENLSKQLSQSEYTPWTPEPIEYQESIRNEKLKEGFIKELFESQRFMEARLIKFKGRIEEMEIAAEKMREEYENKKEAARILGVYLDSSQIPALVKGRLFEVFAARIWDADRRTTIQSWTPDKGINENIYIKSNGDPDFLLELDTQYESESKFMAVECKYRSIYECGDGQVINWIKYYQYKRYEDYQKCNGRDVYMLLGVGGDPRCPDNLYLGTLEELKRRSEYDEREKFKTLYSTTKSFEPFRVRELTMMDSVYRCVGN